MHPPKVSVIVPVYNDLRVAYCLESLLKQTYPKDAYEIIVVNNNSSAEVEVLIRQFPVIYKNEYRQGANYARNCGLLHATGEIIAFIDADCITTEDWLVELVRGFKTPDIGGVGGRILKQEPKTSVQRLTRDLVKQQLTPQRLFFFPLPYIVTANAAYRATVLHSLGGFDPDLPFGEDVDLAWRVGLLGYRLTTVSDAIIYHEARDTTFKLFQQYFGYAVGHILLFRKYRHITGKRVFVDKYPFYGLMNTIFDALPKAIYRWISRQDSVLTIGSEFLNLITYFALACGACYGAIRYRVPYVPAFGFGLLDK